MMYALGLFSKKRSQMFTVKGFHELITTFTFPDGHNMDKPTVSPILMVGGVTGLKLPIARREVPSTSIAFEVTRGHRLFMGANFTNQWCAHGS